MSCWFTASDPGTLLVGAIFRSGDATAATNILKNVDVRGNTSTPFDLPPGTYRYEFNIMSDAAFTLFLFDAGVGIACTPSVFDPNDSSLGQAASIDRVTTFKIP